MAYACMYTVRVDSRSGNFCATQYFRILISCTSNTDIYTLQEKGFAFTIQGTQKVLFGTLAAVSADNLGSLALGGFKESCTAYRCCRHCMATRDMMSSKVCRPCHVLCNVQFRYSNHFVYMYMQFREEFELRTKAAHITHCDEISSGRADASRDYGVHRDSF